MFKEEMPRRSTATSSRKSTKAVAGAKTAATATDASETMAIHTAHVAEAYKGIWHDAHRTRQLHYCLYEPWREWVEGCGDDFAALFKRREYGSCLVRVVEGLVTPAVSAAAAAEAKTAKGAKAKAKISSGGDTDDSANSPLSPPSPPPVVTSSGDVLSPSRVVIIRGLASLVTVLIAASLQHDDEGSNANGETATASDEVSLAPSDFISVVGALGAFVRMNERAAFAVAADVRRHLLLQSSNPTPSQSVQSFGIDSESPSSPRGGGGAPSMSPTCTPSPSADLLAAHFPSFGPNGAQKGAAYQRGARAGNANSNANRTGAGTTEQLIFELVLDVVTCPPVALGDRLAMLLPPSGHQSKNVRALAEEGAVAQQVKHEPVASLVPPSTPAPQPTVPFLSFIPSSLTATVRSSEPCEQFKGSAALWSEANMMLCPADYAAMLLAMRCAAALVGGLKRATAAATAASAAARLAREAEAEEEEDDVCDAVEKGGAAVSSRAKGCPLLSSPSSPPSSSFVFPPPLSRRVEEQCEAFVADAGAFLDFLALAQRWLVVEGDGDPSDPFGVEDVIPSVSTVLAARGSGKGQGAPPEKVRCWAADAAVTAALSAVRQSSTINPSVDVRPFMHTQCPRSGGSNGATANDPIAAAGTFSPTTTAADGTRPDKNSDCGDGSIARPPPSFASCRLTLVPVVQRLALGGMHFAPIAPKACDDEGRYAFESLIDLSDRGRAPVAVVPRRGEGGAGDGDAASLCDVGSVAQPGAGSGRDSLLPLSFFCGPFAPQCCVGSFVGFGLTLKCLREQRQRQLAIDAEWRREESGALRGGKRSREEEEGEDEGYFSPEDDNAFSSSTLHRSVLLSLLRSSRTVEALPPAAPLLPPSLNGPVIVLGMGGNVCLNLLAEQLLAPTPEGSAFLEANPLFSLHVVELEPAVVRTCGLSGLLPGYEAVPANGGFVEEKEGLRTVFLPSYVTPSMCTRMGGGEGGNEESGDARKDGLSIAVAPSCQTPSWATRNVLPTSSSSAEEAGDATATDDATHAAQWDLWRANISERVYYHVGVDALTVDLGALVSRAHYVRSRALARGDGADKIADGDVEDVVAIFPPLLSPFIFFDCFDPVVNAIAEATDSLLDRFRQWLCQRSNGLLLVNSHFSWDGSGGVAVDEAPPAGIGAAKTLAPFLSAFPSGSVDVWQFGSWAQYGIAAFANNDAEKGEKEFFSFSTAQYSAALSSMLQCPLMDKAVSGSITASGGAIAGGGISPSAAAAQSGEVTTKGVRGRGVGAAGSGGAHHSPKTRKGPSSPLFRMTPHAAAEHVTRFRCVQRNYPIALLPSIDAAALRAAKRKRAGSSNGGASSSRPSSPLPQLEAAAGTAATVFSAAVSPSPANAGDASTGSNSHSAVTLVASVLDRPPAAVVSPTVGRGRGRGGRGRGRGRAAAYVPTAFSDLDSDDDLPIDKYRCDGVTAAPPTAVVSAVSCLNPYADPSVPKFTLWLGR